MPPGNSSFLTKKSRFRTVKFVKAKFKLLVPRITQSGLLSHYNASYELVFKIQTAHTKTQGNSKKQKSFLKLLSHYYFFHMNTFGSV